MTTINATTRTFARHSRQSGYEYASDFERTRRADTGGIVIAVVVLAPIVAALVGYWVGVLL